MTRILKPKEYYVTVLVILYLINIGLAVYLIRAATHFQVILSLSLVFVMYNGISLVQIFTRIHKLARDYEALVETSSLISPLAAALLKEDFRNEHFHTLYKYKIKLPGEV